MSDEETAIAIFNTCSSNGKYLTESELKYALGKVKWVSDHQSPA